MNINNRYLSGTLLVLIGVLLGIILIMLQQGRFTNPYSKVKVTEIKKNKDQLITDRELQQLGGRFLFEQVVNKVMPSVVYISAIVTFDEPGNDDDSLLDLFHGRLRSVGTGVIISENGYIVTNYHVIEGAQDGSIKVVLHDNRIFRAHIVGTDPTTDLAVLKINAQNLQPITFGNSNKVDIGEWVLAIGNPFRLRSTVTAGIVSALSRQIQIGHGRDSRLTIENFIQTDAAINRGNSGGPLVNTSGQLIGINTAIASSSGRYQGYGFAIPSNLVREVATDLIEDGNIERARLGVKISTVSSWRAQELGMNAIRGVEIVEVKENGPAQKAGLQPHDVVLAVNGMPVNQASQLQQKIAIQTPGETVKLKIWREGDIRKVKVTLGMFKPQKQLAVPE